MNVHVPNSVPKTLRGHSFAGALVRGASKGAMILVVALTGLVGCSDYSPGRDYTPVDPPVSPPIPVLTSVNIVVPSDTIELSQIVTASVAALDQFGHPIATGPATFTSSTSGIVVAGATSGLIFGVSPGTADIAATINGKTGHLTITVVKPRIRINEIVTNGDVPGGFIELINPSDKDVDLGGFTLTTLDVFNVVALPPGFIIPAHGYLTVNEINFPRGIGASDAIRLFSRFDAILDQFSWVGNPQQDFSRCPELDGPFLVRAPTRRAANDCENTQVPSVVTNNRRGGR